MIAGNHELTFDPTFFRDNSLRRFGLNAGDIQKYKGDRKISRMADVLTNCTYLEDSETTVYGIRIYGSPW